MKEEMKLVSGTTLVAQQWKALGMKNMRLTRRNKGALFVQFFASFFFVLMMYASNKVSEARARTKDQHRDVRDPLGVDLSQPITPCEYFSVKRPCFDFVWSGDSNNARISSIVQGIMNNNPGRAIPSSKVKSFKTQEETNAWFSSNRARCPGALHFSDKSDKVISYITQTNSSVSTKVSKEDISSLFQFPLQVAVEREIARVLTKNQNLNWTVGWKDIAHPALPFSDESLFSKMGSTCLSMITLFVFQNQLINLALEKEHHLRQAMNIMGLYDTAYWLSWLVWEIIMTFLTALSTIIFGAIFRFDFFSRNNFLVLFLVFYLYLLSMTSVAFVASAFVKRAGSANQVTSCVFFVIVGVQVMTQSMGKKSKMFNLIRKLIPPAAYNSAIQMLTDSTRTPHDPGMSWKDRNQCPPESAQECLYTMDQVYVQLIVDFFVWFLLALYFDNVVPSENGIPKPFLYFLNPGYWTGQGGSSASGSVDIFNFKSSTPQQEVITPDDEDVLEEENNIKRQLDSGSLDPDVAVQIRGLIKTYPGKVKNFFQSSPPFHAIKGLWVNFPKDQLFCLLGHNGAGKSTTISCLTGITSVSGGDALVYQHSVRSSVGMSNIRKIIGVCPQFDILWNALTGEEHLELFSSIKGLPPDSIPTIIHQLLEDVKLSNSAKVRAGSYSGGMRRRLSVAAALIGDPKLVILDEPTTGMDPITRRHVWDIIENAKKGRAIVLTTHSMEEADVLGDRIGIMAKGRLRCIGTSLRLKTRFGTGFVANLSFSNFADEPTSAKSRDALKIFFKTQLDVIPTEESQKFLTFVIPHDKEPLLKRTFGEVQERQSEFGISDIQLGLATLEEVFLNVTKQKEAEQ